MKPTIKSGDVFKSNTGKDLVVVEYINVGNIIVEHCDEYKHRVKVTRQQLEKGAVKNPFEPSVKGVGFFGVGDYNSSINGVKTKEYLVWVGLIGRCYCPVKIKKNPTYANAKVCDEWHNFQNFAEWYVNHEFYGRGYQIDKDILIRGNKVYSPDTCVMIPFILNTITLYSEGRKGSFKKGVTFDKVTGKYTSAKSFGVEGKKRSKIYFNTEQEAFDNYKKKKEDYVKEVAMKFKGVIEQRALDAFMSWEVVDE